MSAVSHQVNGRVHVPLEISRVKEQVGVEPAVSVTARQTAVF